MYGVNKYTRMGYPLRQRVKRNVEGTVEVCVARETSAGAPSLGTC
jgi:hypothetical protein